MTNGKRKTGLLLLMMFLLIVCGFSVSASSSEVTIDDLIIKQGDFISANSGMKYHTLSAHDGCGYIDSAGRERLFNAIYMANYGIDIYGPVQKYNALDGKFYWIYKYNDEEVPAEIFLPELYDIVITPEPYRTRATSYYLVLKIPEGKPVTAVPKLIRTSYRSVYNNGSTDVYETAALYYGGEVIRIKPDNNDNDTFFLIEWDLQNSDYILPECTLTPPEGMVFVQWNLGKPGDAITLTKPVTTLEPQWGYSINDASVTVSDQTYTGKALTPALTVTLNGKTLVKGMDYSVTYSNNINAGTATAIIKGIGTNIGKAEKTFKIKPASLSAAVKIDQIADQYYTGSSIEPAYKLSSVSASQPMPVAGTDFDASYKNTINAGKATLTLTGKGNYTGMVTVTFTIKPAALSAAVKIDQIADQYYTGSSIKPAYKLSKVSTSLPMPSAGTDFDAVYKNATKAGTAKLTLTDKGNYTGTVMTTYKIVYRPKKTVFTTKTGIYKITKGGPSGTAEVAFTAPANAKATEQKIPATVTYQEVKYKVTSIVAKAFFKNKKVKKLTIGKNIAKIGAKAFYGCSNLRYITLLTKKLTSTSHGSSVYKNTHKKARFTVPGAKFKSYRKWILKAGASKASKFIKK